MPVSLTELRSDPSQVQDLPLLLIVVGANIEAEVSDRLTAMELAQELEARLESDRSRCVVILTDLWYVNHAHLHGHPVISIGAPEINAATAMLATRTPTMLLADDRYRIHLDPELIDLRCCLWGKGPSATRDAVHVFLKKYADEFIAAIPRSA